MHRDQEAFSTFFYRDGTTLFLLGEMPLLRNEKSPAGIQDFTAEPLLNGTQAIRLLSVFGHNDGIA
jgi:hypothetical protein